MNLGAYWKHSVLFRTALLVVIVLSLLSALTLSLSIQATYDRAHHSAMSRLGNLIDTVDSTLQAACFVEDQPLADDLAKGLLSNDEVRNVAIWASNRLLAEQHRDTKSAHAPGAFNVERKPEGLFDAVLTQFFHLDEASDVIERAIHSPFKEGEVIGTIRLTPDPAVIQRTILDEIHFVAMQMAGQILLAALILLVSMLLFVVRPIKIILDRLHHMDAKSGDRLIAPKGQEHTEIGRLVDDVNVLADNLVASLDEEKALRIQQEIDERKYFAIFENAESGIFIFDNDGTLTSCNSAFTRLFNTPTDWLLARNFSIADLPWEAPKQVDALVEAALERGGLVEADLSIHPAGEGPRWLNIVLSPIDASQIQGLAQDITGRKQLMAAMETARQEAEAASLAKSMFLANMSHEIRTPMSAIVGLGHLLARDAHSPIQKQRLEQLCASSDHLLALINDILDISRIEAQKLRLVNSDFSLGSVIERVLRMVDGKAQERGLTLNTEFAPDLADLHLLGDPLRLSQVLINLCGNAIKFTDHGHVQLHVENLAETPTQVTLRFSVEDTGIGISGQDQARLFQPFSQIDMSSTREYGGTGLGLSISQQLVALMGGEIACASVVGRGSTFSFEVTFPRARQPVPDSPEAQTDSSDFQGKRILLAEDHTLSQEILLEMLAGLGCEVDAVREGAAALAHARTHAYDLILMDMLMPKLDGLAATRAIRALPQHENTPILALTANVFAEDRQRCLDAGMNDHLSKPVTQTTLNQALARWLPGLALAAVVKKPCQENALSLALRQIPGMQIDPDRLCASENAAYCRLLAKFINTHEHDMTQVREQMNAGNSAAAIVVAHNLKGIAGFIGAQKIASLASEIVQGLDAKLGADFLQMIVNECEVELGNLADAVKGLPE